MGGRKASAGEIANMAFLNFATKGKIHYIARGTVNLRKLITKGGNENSGPAPLEGCEVLGPPPLLIILYCQGQCILDTQIFIFYNVRCSLTRLKLTI